MLDKILAKFRASVERPDLEPTKFAVERVTSLLHADSKRIFESNFRFICQNKKGDVFFLATLTGVCFLNLKSARYGYFFK